jgi:FAD-dependent monooxygenase
MKAHLAMNEFLSDDPHLVEQDSSEGQALRSKIHHHYQNHSGENTDLGIEMDHRHKSDAYPLSTDSDGPDPQWDPAYYTPNTHIGSRAPHVFLKDGSPIFDHYGLYWTLIQFIGRGEDQKQPTTLLDAARDIDMPLKHVILYNEDTAQKIWQCALVLVRPDGHVGWRGQVAPDAAKAKEIVQILSGRTTGTEHSEGQSAVPLDSFTATSGMASQVREYQLEKMGDMQM